MKAMLEEKKASLEKSLENLAQQQTSLAEQITMHRGALQYNSMLLKELADKEVAEAPKAELKAVEEAVVSA